MFLGLPGNAQAENSQEEQEAKKHRRRSQALGTDIEFTILHHDEKLANLAIDEALAQIETVEKVMSLYRPDSQINQLNNHGLLRDPDPMFSHVLSKAKKLSELSAGAFDVTIQPLWKLFHSRSLQGRLPDAKEIQIAKEKIGWKHIDIQKDHICLNQPGAQVSLNGIAQGLAADMAQKALKARGIEHALIDTGELNASNHPAPTETWKIGIQHSRKPENLCKANLKNRCMSSSGDYQTTFSDDYRHHHLFDPRTGSSPTELANVTVIAPTAMEADALSTAVFVLGLEKGMKMISNLAKVDALFVTKEGQVKFTKNFPIE